jgi:hypothetical protein
MELIRGDAAHWVRIVIFRGGPAWRMPNWPMLGLAPEH